MRGTAVGEALELAADMAVVPMEQISLVEHTTSAHVHLKECGLHAERAKLGAKVGKEATRRCHGKAVRRALGSATAPVRVDEGGDIGERAAHPLEAEGDHGAEDEVETTEDDHDAPGDDLWPRACINGEEAGGAVEDAATGGKLKEGERALDGERLDRRRRPSARTFY